MQNIQRKAFHGLGVGKSGTGKTSYLERYIIGSHHERVLIYDHQGEFQQRLNLLPVYDFDDMLERVRTERILCFDYSMAYEGEMEETFEVFCEWCFWFAKEFLNPQKKEGLMVCDEVQKCTTPNYMPKPFKNIVQTGRRFNLDTFCLSQQPNELHNSYRNQVTEFVCYRLQDERATEWVKNAGVDVEAVKRLPDLNYLWQNMQSGEVRTGKIDYPKKK